VILFPDNIEVEVTEEDIEKGVPGSPEFCAVSRALRRTVSKDSSEGEAGTYVYRDTLTIRDPDDKASAIYDVPPDARRFIWRFDRNRFSVEPARFRFRRTR